MGLTRAECHRILGVSMSAPEEEVRAAYRDLVRVWHPDRFDHDPELRERAERKLQEINEAWETLKRGPAVAPPGGSRPSPPTPHAAVRSRTGLPLLRIAYLVVPVIAIVLLVTWSARRFDAIWSEVAGVVPPAEEVALPGSTEKAIREVVSALSERRFAQAGVLEVRRRPSADAESVGSVSLDDVIVTEDQVFGWHRIVDVGEPSRTIGWAQISDVATLEEIGILDPRERPASPPGPAPVLGSDEERRVTVSNVEAPSEDLAAGFVRHGTSAPPSRPGREVASGFRPPDLDRLCADRDFPGTAAHRSCVETAASRLAEVSTALRTLEAEESATLEGDCLTLDGAVAFADCVHDRMQAREAAEPLLADLERVERASARVACAHRLGAGESGYESCLAGELADLEGTIPVPDLTWLSRQERSVLDSACAVSRSDAEGLR